MASNKHKGSWADRPEHVMAEKRKELESASNNMLKFPARQQPHSLLMIFEKYSYKGFADAYQNKQFNNTVGGLFAGLTSNRQAGIGLRSTSSVELPFPKNLNDNLGLIYSDMQQSPLIEKAAIMAGDFFKNAGGSGDGSTLSDIPKLLQNMGANGAQAYAGGGGMGKAIGALASSIAATGVSDATNVATYLLRKTLNTLPGVGDSIDLARGQTLNPRETLAFQGVNLKTHQFQWDLYPESESDSGRIKSIINTLKKNVLPVTRDIGTGKLAIKKAFLEYPHTCKMYLIGVDDEYFMQFKPCVIKSVNIDYGPGGGVSIMKGGKPAGVTLQLEMQELQIETAEDYGAQSATAQEGKTIEEIEDAFDTKEEVQGGTQPTPRLISV
jgi:hypothetical protein